MNRGRHASESTAPFYRDLVMMIAGILLVGAAVFLFLYLLSGGPEAVAGDTTGPDPVTATSRTTTATAESTTTTGAVTTTTSTTLAATTVPVRPPAEVRVVVLNSIGLDGAAGRMTQQVADAGYQTQQADDLEPQQDRSRIWYREGFEAEANTLLQFLSDALLEPLPDPELQPGADVILVLGAGYTE